MAWVHSTSRHRGGSWGPQGQCCCPRPGVYLDSRASLITPVWKRQRPAQSSLSAASPAVELLSRPRGSGTVGLRGRDSGRRPWGCTWRAGRPSDPCPPPCEMGWRGPWGPCVTARGHTVGRWRPRAARRTEGVRLSSPAHGALGAGHTAGAGRPAGMAPAGGSSRGTPGVADWKLS